MTDHTTPESIQSKIENLEAQRPSLGDVAVDAAVAALRQQLAELTPVVTGHIEAGRDISARDIVTGAQHITQLYLDTKDEPREAIYRHALTRYLAWLHDAMGQVVLRGILKRAGKEAVALSLADIYVPLAAETQPEDDDRLQRQLQNMIRHRNTALLDELDLGVTRNISMRQLLNQGPRLIVVGAPGCGKTTVLQHVAFTLCQALQTNQLELAKNELGLDGPLPLPIYIPLNRFADHRRRFAKDRDPRQRQLATFVSHYLIEKQADLNLPDDFFATLVTRGEHLILLLDGLDEVPNEAERARVSQAVTDLTHGRPNLRVVVTSRSRAYQGEAVLDSQFRLIRVLPLAPEQVAELINHAYRALYPQAHHLSQREQLAADLIDGVTRLETERARRLDESLDSRLVTTPLMVRMLLIVHVNQRRLPDQRAELYAEVVDTLMTSAHHPDRDVAQDLSKQGGDWRNQRDMLQFLAFQMHSRGLGAGRGIEEPELEALLTGYLTKRRQKAPEQADQLVADFVKTSRQRESLLEENGGRYRFSHFSFQEFLAARFLAETRRDPARIVNFVKAKSRATDAWWREPILLTTGYLNVTSPEAAADLITKLAGLTVAPLPPLVLSLAMAELAATGFLEWGGAEAIQQQLAARLAELLTERNLTEAKPPLRVVAGRVLAQLDDPREGVITLPLKMTGMIAGKFLYGEKKRERETVPFRASVYPITNAQFKLFMDAGGYTNRKWWSEDGWQWRSGKPQRPHQKMDQPDYWDNPNFNDPNQPVVGVTWYEAEAFSNWLSDWTNEQITNGEWRVMDGELQIANDELVDDTQSKMPDTAGQALQNRKSKIVFRLPTENEWERLARGQNGREYPWGNDWAADVCNTSETNVKRTSAVGIFPGGESPTGAHDCAGNVWEWCQDWYDADKDVRVLRGSSWVFDKDATRCAVRYRNHPNHGYSSVGFRVIALTPSGNSES